ncbi:MAG: GNAT family N-acetyltransferase [Pseudomonadota bacterium]
MVHPRPRTYSADAQRHAPLWRSERVRSRRANNSSRACAPGKPGSGEREGAVVGIAVWFFNFSPWTGRHGIYLEDLYVDPQARGGGIARKLFEAV